MSARDAQPTKTAWKRFDSKCNALDRIHDCPPGSQVHRVQSPGLDLNDITNAGAFITRWTCPACEPLFAALVDELFGGHELKLPTAPVPEDRT